MAITILTNEDKAELEQKINANEDSINALSEETAKKNDIPDVSAFLDKTALPEAINVALAQAKASGEFDGAAALCRAASDK